MEVDHARLSLHLSKCHIVVNHMSRLKCYLDTNPEHRFFACLGDMSLVSRKKKQIFLRTAKEQTSLISALSLLFALWKVY